MSCPNLALDPRTATAPPPSDATTQDSASEALAAIASTYEDARAGIISGDSSPSGEQPSAEKPSAEQHTEALLLPRARTGHSPTVPLTLMSALNRAEPPQNSPAGERGAMTAFWSRLLRRGQTARRGRHSATESDGLPPEAFRWGPPGRVRFLPQDGPA